MTYGCLICFAEDTQWVQGVSAWIQNLPLLSDLLLSCNARFHDSEFFSFNSHIAFQHPVSLIPHAFTEATISSFAFFSKKRLVDFVLHILQYIDTLLTVISFCKPVISCAICYISRQKANPVSFDIYVHIMYLLKFYEEHLHKLRATYSWSVIKICCF